MIYFWISVNLWIGYYVRMVHGNKFYMFFFYNGTLIVMHTHIPVFESIAFEKYGRNYYLIEWWNFTNAKCFCLFIAHHQKVNKSKINHDCDLYWFYQTWLHEYKFKCPLIWKYNFKTQKIFFCWKIITKKNTPGNSVFYVLVQQYWWEISKDSLCCFIWC